jgi:hypothetical protein
MVTCSDLRARLANVQTEPITLARYFTARRANKSNTDTFSCAEEQEEEIMYY